MSANDESSAPSFEVSLAELEAIVHDLEEGQFGLAESLSRYEEGVKHLKNCYQLLQAAERKIELLTGITEEGTPLTQQFIEEEAQPSPASPGRRRRAKAPQSLASPPAEGAHEDQPHDIDGQKPSI